MNEGLGKVGWPTGGVVGWVRVEMREGEWPLLLCVPGGEATAAAAAGPVAAKVTHSVPEPPLVTYRRTTD